MAANGFRRAAVLAVPAMVPVQMAALFAVLSRGRSRHAAYNMGFLVYWLGWCFGFPAWILGPRRALQLLAGGRRPSVLEAALLLLPVAGAVGSELLPNRKKIDPQLAGVALATGVINAVGEELLWRGVFLEAFPQDRLRGLVWPLLGFSLWHLAPQIVLPSRHGRWRFVVGAAFVGSASAISAWRSQGLRNCVLPHVLTDACGVTAARFRLGR